MKKKIFAVLALAFLLALSMAPAAWAATVASGECGAEGDNVTWVLDDTGTLTISGQGAMADYDIVDRPWKDVVSEVKNIVIEYEVTTIGNRAFASCENLVSINITDSLISIGDSTFDGCKSLRSINIPDNVTSIGDAAFADCRSLISITIPDSVTIIGDSTFWVCESLTSIIIPDGVTSIGNRAFWSCTSLTSINIPNSVTTIGDNTFRFCENLTNITLPDNVTNIGDNVFGNCNSLTDINVDAKNPAYKSVNGILFDKAMSTLKQCPAGTELESFVIPDTVTVIEEYAFNECNNLTSINIPNSVTSIGDWAFGNCQSLISITIPDSVTNIGDYVFNYCSSLTDINVGAKNPAYKSVNGILFDKTMLTLIKCPAKNELKIFVVPDGVTAISEYAFDECENLTGISIPDSLISIDSFAFGRCTNLSHVYYAGTQEDWKKITINNEYYGNDNLINATIHYNSTGPEKPDTIPVTGITLDKTALTMEVKTTEQIKATVLPADTTSTISWTSSNEKVAIVDNTGKVTALTKGTATITAAADGIKAECNVTVTADDVYTITFDTDGGTLAAGITNPDYVIKGETYKMPTATKSRYTLTAWAIGDKDSENKVKANDVYTFTADTTVYAIWQYNGGGGGSHGGSSWPSGTTTTKPGTTEKPGDTNKPGTTIDNNKTVTAANVNNKFADVQNNAWYSEAIAYVYNKGMMNGTDAGKFEPDATTTRAMLVTMLFRLEGEPKAGAADFSDVASGQWFSEAIAWAAANGVVNGYKDGTFAPNDMITREQLAAVLYRFAQFKGYDVSVKGSLSNFSDSGSVSDWAQEAMQWAVGAGIINGDNGALKPAGNATRAEVAMMLMRFCENVAK